MTTLSLEGLLELAPAYVMGTLTPDERSAFERALTDPAMSAALMPELQAIRATTDHLATSFAVTPPAALRERVLARIAAEPQAGQSSPSSKAGLRLETSPMRAPRRATRWWTAGLITALAASVMFAVSLARQLGTLRTTASEQAKALASAELRLRDRDETVRILTEGGNDLVLVRLAANTNTGPAMQIFWNVKEGTAVVHASGLKPVAANRTYALWMIRDGKPVPVTLFNPDADGHRLLNSIPVPRDLLGVAAFAVTEEPAAGSPQPTMTPFLVGAVAPR